MPRNFSSSCRMPITSTSVAQGIWSRVTATIISPRPSCRFSIAWEQRRQELDSAVPGSFEPFQQNLILEVRGRGARFLVLVADHQLAAVALAFLSVPMAAFTSAAIRWPWLVWWSKKVSASIVKSRHLLIIAAK